jgi:hypothetical protein
MSPSNLFRVSLLAILALAASPVPAADKCPPDQVKREGKCLPLCPKEGPVADTEACACPPGTSMLMTGAKGGECRPAACPESEPFKDQPCQCVRGMVKKPAGGGKVKCTAPEKKPTGAAKEAGAAKKPAGTP